ncbi:hypothetical protein DTQ70_21770 [Runella sp. SP2]|nr:hypothetical protein DTQ70_21770 [Runella sp. SP2]
MMVCRKRFFVLLFLSFSPCIAQKDTSHVLFIGNSLTYSNDMPAILQQMFETGKDKNYILYSATLPGITLEQHLELLLSNTDEKVSTGRQLVLGKDTFQKRKFDYVILQEATVRMLIPEIRKQSFRCIEQLDSLIKENGGKTVLYQNYPIYNYPHSYCLPDPVKFKYDSDAFYCSEELLNSKQEVEILVKACTEIGNRIGAKITPIGQAFEQLKRLNPRYDLLSDDGHPSKVGSYLIASFFYWIITERCFKKTGEFTEVPEFQKLDIIEVCESLN